MSLESFFKKDVVIMPSGQKPLDSSVKVSKYARPLMDAVKKTAGVMALASLLAACSHSYTEIDAMKDKVPEQQRKEITMQYDDMLLDKIDSVRYSGKDMADAVTIGLEEARKTASVNMPEKQAQWSGKDYVLNDHMAKRDKEGHPLMLSINGHDFYKTNTDFRDKLMRSVQKEKADQEGHVSLRLIKSRQITH